MALAPITPGMVFVFTLILVALVMFATEPVPIDITAIGVMVALLLVEPLSVLAADLGLLADPLIVLSDPERGISAVERGISGFANPATITVLAMFVLSAGVQRTGIIQIAGRKIAALTRDSESRQLGATIGFVSPISGFINNTAAVAILLPMVTDLAHEGNTSPSKLLLPLSYASMFGGMLTLIGTSTNILASEIAGRLGQQYPTLDLRSFSMFEFTELGLVLTVVGAAYLMTVGRWLTPARIKPDEDLTEEFEMGEYLTEVVVREDSPVTGGTVREAMAEFDFDVDLIQLIRDDEVFLEPLGQKTIRAGNVFAIRTDRDTLVEVSDAEGFDLLPEVEVDEAELEAANERQNLVEVVVAPGAKLVGETLASSEFRQQFDANVLALRRGGEVFRKRMNRASLRVGDTLLVQGTPETLERLDRDRNFIVVGEIQRPDFRESKIYVALGIVAAVVGLAAIGLLPIVTAALAGSLAMVATGCLRPPEVYEAVQWDVIFLLAGVIPLGIAMEQTGGAALIADLVVLAAASLPTVAVLGLLYVVTALLTNVISNNASVVLMVPVAVTVAIELGASAFSFVLAVTFAASTAFMTPVGYQTNLFVYGPGGYRFTDYIRVGAPLQLVFAVATTLGIAFFFGV